MMLSTTWAEQDLERHEREQEEWLLSRPVCVYCDEPIQEDIYFEPEPGQIYCEECFREYVRDNFLHEIE